MSAATNKLNLPDQYLGQVLFKDAVLESLLRRADEAAIAVPALRQIIKVRSDKTSSRELTRIRQAVKILGRIGPDAEPALTDLRSLRGNSRDYWVRDATGESIWLIETAIKNGRR